MEEQCDSVDSNAGAPLLFIADVDCRGSIHQSTENVGIFKSKCQTVQTMILTNDNPASSVPEQATVESGNTKHVATSQSRSGHVSRTHTSQCMHIDSDKVIVGFSPVKQSDGSSADCYGDLSDTSSQRLNGLAVVHTHDVRVPIVGFEVMQQRSKFTVYKLHVHKGTNSNWFIFRRYTDFVQLHSKLKQLFPMFHLRLPPKRWFRDNYEKDFLADRMHGLQAFINSVLCHANLCNSEPVQEFFCFSDPPGPHDSIEESRAYCDQLEDAIYNLKKVVHDKNVEIELLCEELNLYKSQVEMLSKALRETNANYGKQFSGAANPLVDCDPMAHVGNQLKCTLLEYTNGQSETRQLDLINKKL